MEIPNRLECAYCIRSRSHGGECTGKRNNNDEVGCLVFKLDNRGCIRNSDFKLPVPLYSNIPPIDCWVNDYTMKGLETEIRINRIYSLSWDSKNGYLYIHCNCDYYINEYHEDYKEDIEKPKLKIIK